MQQLCLSIDPKAIIAFAIDRRPGEALPTARGFDQN
jgi:hypothetical protein